MTIEPHTTHTFTLDVSHRELEILHNVLCNQRESLSPESLPWGGDPEVDCFRAEIDELLQVFNSTRKHLMAVNDFDYRNRAVDRCNTAMDRKPAAGMEAS